MIEAILNDAVDSHPMENESPFDSSIDYAAELKKREDFTRTWKTLSPEKQSEQKGEIKNYLITCGALDLRARSQ